MSTMRLPVVPWSIVVSWAVAAGLCFAVATSAANVGAAETAVHWPLAGTVVDLAGLPLAGADVWLAAVENETVAVAATTKTDAAGRFEFAEQPPSTHGYWTVWAGGDGFGLDFQVVPSRGLRQPALELTLEEPVSRSVRLLDPQGNPLAGVPLRMDGFSRWPTSRGDYGLLPLEVAARLAVRTDADGRCEMVGLPARSFLDFEPLLPRFGGQRFRFSTDVDTAAGVICRYSATSTIRGRFVAEDPKAAAGLRLIVRSYPEKRTPESFASAVAVVESDAVGAFEFSPVAPGRINVTLDGLADPALRAELPASGLLAEGETLEWQIPLSRGAHVYGVVRSQDDDQPVAGATLIVMCTRGRGGVDYAELISDERGGLDGYIAAGRVDVIFSRVPPPFLEPQVGNVIYGEMAAGGDYDLGDFFLARGVELRGLVIDQQDRPLAGATVTAVWHTMQYDLVNEHTRTAETDEAGEFTLTQIPPGQSVTLRATLGGAASDEPLTAVAGDATAVALRLGLRENVAVRGRIVDGGGVPIGGARVFFECQWGDGQKPADVYFGRQVMTDGEGRFATPAMLQPHLPLTMHVRAPDCLPLQAAPFVAGHLEDYTLPDATMTRLRTIAGRVVDLRGERVAGATVFQTGNYQERTETTTDATGRFELPGFPDSAACLFAECEEYRFHGRSVAAGVERLEIVLTRLDEQAEPRFTLPAAMEGERKIVASGVLAPYLRAALAGPDVDLKFTLLRRRAAIDPHGMLSDLTEHPLDRGPLDDSIRATAIDTLLREDVETFIPLIPTLQGAHLRAIRYCESADLVPADQTERKLQLLRQALEHARQIADPKARPSYLAGIARRLLDLDQREEAADLLREGERIVAGGVRGSISAWFAADLAPIDLPAALELTKDLRDDHDWHHDRIAVRLAGSDPAAAERVLAMLRQDNYRERAAARMGPRMAGIDLERALRLVRGLPDAVDRAYALGMVAESLAGQDPTTAEALLREAYALLLAPPPPSKARRAAGALVGVAEAIDPGLVEEFFWQAASLRQPAAAFEGNLPEGAYSQARLALMLARYDRDIARTLLEPIAARLPEFLTHMGEFVPVILAAAAEIDPTWAAELVERLPPPASLSPDELQHRARLTVAEVLARRDDARWQSWSAEYLGLWTQDSGD